MKRYIAIALLAVVMIGCGSKSSGPDSETEKTTKLKGIAVDDLIVNGIVSAYAASNSSTVLATGRTDADNGSYVLDVSYDGVIIIKVTCDANSLMKNPVDNTTKACISGLQLRSAVAVTPTSGEIEVNTSPLSELMVRQMNENGTTVADLTEAQNNIGLMFGLDPVAENPVENNSYSKIIGAIHSMVDSDSNKTILDIIDEINNDLKDGIAGDDGNISTQLAQAMTNKNVSNNLTENNGNYTPPTNAAPLSDIAQSKEFFNSLRTQAMSVVDYKNSGTPGFLDNEVDNLGTALGDVALNAGIAGDYVASITGNILEAIDNDSDESTNTIEKGTRSVTVTKSQTDSSVWTYIVVGTSYTGTVTLPVETPSDISPDNFTSLNLVFDGTIPLKEVGNSSNAGEQTFTTNMTLTKTTAGADFILSNAILSTDVESLNISNLSISTKYDYNNTAEDDKLSMHFIELQSLTFGGVISGYSMGGTLLVPTYVLNSSLNGKGFIEENNGDYNSDEKFYNSANLPKVITFTGDINNTTTNASLSGTLNVDWLNAATMDLTEGSNDKQSINISFNGKLQIPSIPMMIINLGYTNPSQNNNFTFSYSYDATVINGSGNFDQDMENGTITLTNHLGLEATIIQADGNTVYGSQSSVKKSGKSIGELQEREGVPVIKYIDGTFESLP